MKTLLLMCSILSTSLFAQEKYIMLKPLTWDELQLYQLDNLKTVNELKLANVCPSTLKKLQDDLTNKTTHMQYIHGTLYTWTEHTNDEGLTCIVKHEKINSITQEKDKPINPNDYELLNITQARVLKSASLGDGNTDKELERKKRIAEVHRINQAIQAIPYEKYGGIENLINYMKENEPSFSVDKRLLEDRTYTTAYGSHGVKLLSPLQIFEIKYSKKQQNELIESVKKNEIKNETIASVKSTMVRVPDSKIHDSNFLPTYPYGGVGRNEVIFPGGFAGQGSDLQISDYVSLTAAHVVSRDDLFLGNVLADFLVSYKGAVPNGSGGYITYFGSIIADDFKYSTTYFPSNPKVSEDYGAIRSFVPFPLAFNTGLIIDTSNPRYINAVGYPGNRVGMHEGYALAEFDDFFCGTFNPAITFDIDVSGGASGGPLFNQNETYSTGIVTSFCPDDELGGGVSFDSRIGNEIQSWLWSPTGNMLIQSPIPNITFNLVTIPPFEGTFNTFNKMDIQGNIEIRGNDFDHLIEWESSNDGLIGQGGIISSDTLKATLSGGFHRITAKIDSSGESGEKNININIIRPTGNFTSSDFCIIDLANSPNNTCPITISWNVTDTPETSVVWNAMANSQFATGNSGNKSYTATTSNTKFELYPSDQRKILLDTSNVSAKLPTGNLSNDDVSVCSLEPTPIDPNTGSFRDSKATPPGCGTQLSWSNVRWASPSVFYKVIGASKGSWQHLYQIPCQLNGEVCSGSINTDEIIPELIPENGVEFKLLQFNDANSGLLSSQFTVTAHRYADIYDYDNGSFPGVDSGNQLSELVTTNTEIGVIQHNHNFHSPAVYNPNTDIDTLQISVIQPSNPNGSGFVDGTVLTVTVSNMVNGLNVGMSLVCAGGFIDTSDPFEPIDRFDIYQFTESPINSIIVDPVTGDKTMEFVVKNNTVNNGIFIPCLFNRIVLTRLSGTPSENLTYSVVVNETTTTPPTPSGINWINKVNVTATETSITKTGTTGWDGGAISTETLYGDGYLEFKKGINTSTMIGLSNGDSSQSYTDIDFAIYMTGGNQYMVYESGSNKWQSGSFVASDIFRIEVIGATVKYLKNNNVFYTSTNTPVFPLNIVTSLHTIGATITKAIQRTASYKKQQAAQKSIF